MEPNLLIASKKVLTFDEAAAYCGYSKTYMQKLTSSGILPHSKPNGKSIFFDREQLEQWLLRNPRKGLKETREIAATHVSTHK